MENKIAAKIFAELISKTTVNNVKIVLDRCEVSLRDRDGVIEVNTPTDLRVFELNDPKCFDKVLEYIIEQNDEDYYTFYIDAEYFRAISKRKLREIMDNKKMSRKEKYNKINELSNSINVTSDNTDFFLDDTQDAWDDFAQAFKEMEEDE